MIKCALKGNPILDENPNEILVNTSPRGCRNSPIPIWENIVSINCINAQILVYVETTEKGGSFLDDFGNRRKREGFDASRFINLRQALYKKVKCSGFDDE